MSTLNTVAFPAIVVIFMLARIVPSESVMIDSNFASTSNRAIGNEEAPSSEYLEPWIPYSGKISQTSSSQQGIAGRTTSSPTWLTTSESTTGTSRKLEGLREKSGKGMSSNWYRSPGGFQTSNRRFDDGREGSPISSKWSSESPKPLAKYLYKSYEILDDKNESTTSWFQFLSGAEYRIVKGILDECLNSYDTFICLKSKALTLLVRASKMKKIDLFDRVSFVRQHDGTTRDVSVNETDLFASLPRDLNDRNEKLNEMLLDHLLKFWNSHSLVVDYNSEDSDGGRQNKIKKKIKKLGKKHGYLLLPMLAMGGFVFPLMYKGLAALTLKALLAAKVAFVLAAILLLSSFGQKSNSHRSYSVEESEAVEPWSSERYGHSSSEAANRVAYNAQIQRPVLINA